MKKILGVLGISMISMSCNSTGFLSNGGDNSKKSKSGRAGSNAEIGYRNGKFLPTLDELQILTSAENSRMVNYDIDEANAEVEYSYTEILGIALVDLELENPKDAEIAIDHALGYFTSADIAALTEIQEGSNEYYDPYFEFEKEYGYSISESERFNQLYFPEFAALSKAQSSLNLQESDPDPFAYNEAPVTDMEMAFIDAANQGQGQGAADSFNTEVADSPVQLVYGEDNGTHFFNFEAKAGGEALNKGFGSNGSESWAWTQIPNPDGSSNIFKTIYNSAGQEIARVVEAYSKDGKRIMGGCAEGQLKRSDGTCVNPEEAEMEEPLTCESEESSTSSGDSSASSYSQVCSA